MTLRERIFRFSREWRATLHDELKKRIQSASADERAVLGADLGLDFSTGRETFELHALRLAEKIGPDNVVQCQLLVQLLQHRDEAAGGNAFRFGGGATLVVDEKSLKVKYSILKGIGNKARLEQAKAGFAATPSLRQIYFGGTPFTEAGERFAILHKSGDEV